MLPLHIAKKLQKLANGGLLPASELNNALVKEMIAEDIIDVISTGVRKRYVIRDAAIFNTYLASALAIPDLDAYIEALEKEDSTRSDLVEVSGNSKLALRRTFKGFLVNSYMPIACSLNGVPFIVDPVPGTFQFIYDFEQFSIPADVIVVGLENPENFRYASKLRGLLGNDTILFVSRYPQLQSKDLLKWLRSIPNSYLHMGDYDFEGINIYFQEYKKHLGNRASFFIPTLIENLIDNYGNRDLYDKQKLDNVDLSDEPDIAELVALMHQYKKCVEQEALLLGG